MSDQERRRSAKDRRTTLSVEEVSTCLKLSMVKVFTEFPPKLRVVLHDQRVAGAQHHVRVRPEQGGQQEVQAKEKRRLITKKGQKRLLMRYIPVIEYIAVYIKYIYIHICT